MEEAGCHDLYSSQPPGGDGEAWASLSGTTPSLYTVYDQTTHGCGGVWAAVASGVTSVLGHDCSEKQLVHFQRRVNLFTSPSSSASWRNNVVVEGVGGGERSSPAPSSLSHIHSEVIKSNLRTVWLNLKWFPARTLFCLVNTVRHVKDS